MAMKYYFRQHYRILSPNGNFERFEYTTGFCSSVEAQQEIKDYLKLLRNCFKKASLEGRLYPISDKEQDLLTR